MSDLSSCYFCGTALDAPLDRHTLAESGDDPATVVLCPTCRRKLVDVLERVLVAAPDAESETLLARAATAVGDPDDDAPAVADVTPDQGAGGLREVVDATTADGSESADATTADDDPTGDAAPTDIESDDEAADESTESDGSDRAETPPESGRRTAAAGDAEPIFAGPQAGADDDDEAVFGGDADAGAATTGGGVDGPDAEGHGEPAPVDRDPSDDDEVVREAEPTRADAAESAPEDGAVGDDERPRRADEGGGESTASLDAETYNRVIRLLQNREFPVQKTEIEEVAVNAYGMEPTDFRAVIDAAVERGVIDERGDRLVRPN